MFFNKRGLKKDFRNVRVITTIIFTMSVLAYIAKYVLYVFLAHHMSAIEFGDFSIAIKILGLMTSFALLGTDLSSNRFLPTYLSFHQKDNTSSYIAWNIRIISFSFTICVVVALVTALTMHAFHVLGIKRLETYHISVFIIWIAPFASISALLTSYLLCSNHPLYSSFFGNLGKYMIQGILFLTAVFIFDKTLTARTVLAILFLSFLTLILIETLIVYWKAPRIYFEIAHGLAFPRKEKKKDWLDVSLNLITNGIVFTIICALDLIIVKFVCQNQKLVGYYAACLTINAFIWLISSQTYGSLKSKVSGSILTEEGKATLQKDFNQANQVSFWINFMLSITVIVFSRILLSHFGENYTTAQIPLIILIIATFISSLSRPSVVLLSYSGNERALLRVSINELIMYVLLAIPLTYYFQLIGISSAALISILYNTIALHIYARKGVGLKPLSII